MGLSIPMQKEDRFSHIFELFFANTSNVLYIFLLRHLLLNLLL